MSETVVTLPDFKKVGYFRSEGSGAVELVSIAEPFSRDAAVYAFVVDHEVRYVGAAEALARRLSGYRRRQINNSSKRKVHAELRSALRESLGMLSRRQPSTSSSGSKVRRRNSTTIASSISVSTVLFGLLGPIGRSAVVVRLRHFATVLAFRP